MRLIKSFFISFSIYSKIPVPQFEWKEEDMKYMLCFFPWIGAVIGIVLYLFYQLSVAVSVSPIAYVLIGTAIPLIITGGFHADGFMDTMDAFHSYQPREKKLEILKDSHIGAFAVLMFSLYGLLYMGAFAEITNPKLLLGICFGFFLSRALSGIAVVSFPSAKKEGMLATFAQSSEKRRVFYALLIQCILCMIAMLMISPLLAVIIIAALASFLYYYRRTKKELGGITGDTAGYFVLLSECCMMVAAAILNHLL